MASASNGAGLVVVCDSREQDAFPFSGKPYAGTTVVRGSLQTGDYSVKGLENRVAVERKSLADLVACLGVERERFVRELERAKGLDAFAVVCEGSWQELATGQYRSRMNPKAACASVMAFMSRGTQIFFAGNRRSAEWVTHSFLRFYAQDRLDELKALQKAMNYPQGAGTEAGRHG